MSDLMRIWTECLIILEEEVSPVGYITWNKDIKPVEKTDTTFKLSVTTEIIKNMVQIRYYDLIKNTLSEITGKNYDVEFLVQNELR